MISLSITPDGLSCGESNVAGFMGFSDQSADALDFFALMAGNVAPESSHVRRVAVCSVLSGLDGGICLPPFVGCKTRFTRAMSLDFCSLVPGKGISKRIPACCVEAPWQDAHSASSKGRTRCSKWSLEMGFCPAAAIGSCAASVRARSPRAAVFNIEGQVPVICLEDS